MILYAITLRQYLTSPWKIRLALVVIVATAGVVITKCGWQHFVEQPDTIEYWEKNKAELLGPGANATTGKAAGMQHDYEKRMLSRLITGYYPHANVLGSHLILFIMAGASLMGDRLSRIRKKTATSIGLIFPVLIIVGCALALWGTGSKGAAACAALAFVIWMIGTRLSRLVAAAPRLTALTLWSSGIVAAIAIVMLLQHNEAALGKSIQFRSMYWRGAVALIADGHALGVGPNNFGRHFLRYKPVECPEEVESPHSWIVQFAAEWGIPGLIAFLLVLGGLTWRLCRNHNAHGERQERAPPGSILWWSFALSGSVFAYWLFQHADEPSDVIFLSLFLCAAPWFGGVILAGFDTEGEKVYSDDPIVGAMPAVMAGLICFLLHTSIDLALFEGGPATTFFAMIAIALAIHAAPAIVADESMIAPPEAAKPRKGLAVAIAGVSLILAIVAIRYLVVAPFNCWNSLQLGRTYAEPAPWQPYLSIGGGRHYADAIDAYSLDGTAASELAEQLIPRIRTPENADEALRILDEFERRDPYNGLHHNIRGTIAQQKFHMTQDVRFLQDAATEYLKYVDEYPTSPLRRIYAATVLIRLARDFDDADARTEAVRQIETALALDEQRIHVSKPNRLPPDQVEKLRQAIEELGATP